MRQLHRDNRGLSLIELIISILILGIVVAALYTSLTTAFKVNGTATDIYFAENAASNVLEEVSYRTYSTIAAQTAAGGGSYDTSGGSGTGVYTFHSTGDGTGYYTYSNDPYTGTYAEGTGNYEVRITFSKADYDTTANSYVYGDMTDFAADTSLLVNPSAAGMNYDTAALNFFLQSYRNYMYNEWLATWEAYEAWYTEMALAGLNPEYTAAENEAMLTLKGQTATTDQQALLDSYDSSPHTKPAAFTTPTYDADEFKTCFTKQQMIILSPTELDDTLLESATCRIIYTFDNNNSYGYKCTETSRSFEGLSATLTCDNSTLSSKERSVYILYSTFTDDLSSDCLIIVNQVRPSYDASSEIDNPMDIFVVLQADENTDFKDSSGVPLNMTIQLGSLENGSPMTNYTANVSLYCQTSMSLRDVNNNAITSASVYGCRTALMKTNDETHDRIYDVTIEVYAAGSTGECLTKIVSTLTK